MSYFSTPVDRHAAALKAAATRKANAERFGTDTANLFEAGDILTGSWGYDQTNVEFYQVVEARAHSVTIREVAKFASMNGPADRVYACKDQFIGEPIRKMVSAYGYVKLYDFGCSLSKWDGAGKYQTGMGYGH